MCDGFVKCSNGGLFIYFCVLSVFGKLFFGMILRKYVIINFKFVIYCIYLIENIVNWLFNYV